MVVLQCGVVNASLCEGEQWFVHAICSVRDNADVLIVFTGVYIYHFETLHSQLGW